MSLKIQNLDIKNFLNKNMINNINMNPENNQNYNQIKESYANDLFSITNEEVSSKNNDYNILSNSITTNTNKNNINNRIEYVNKLFDNNSINSKSNDTIKKKQKENELFGSNIKNQNKECDMDDNMPNLNINEIKNNINNDNNNDAKDKIVNDSYISLGDININDLPKFYDKNGKILNENTNIISSEKTNIEKINKTKEKIKYDKKNKNSKKHIYEKDIINKNYDGNHKYIKKNEKENKENKENKEILDEDNSKNFLDTNDNPSKNSLTFLFKKANHKNNKRTSNQLNSNQINNIAKNNNINNSDNIKPINEILPININLNVNFNKNNINEIKNHFHTIISSKKVFDENILSEENNNNNKKIKTSRIEKIINLSPENVINTNSNKNYLIDKDSLNNELSYISYLKKNNLIVNNNIFEKVNNNKLQGLLKISFFNEHIFKEETIIDLFESIENNKQVQILQYQYALSTSNYYNNYTNFAIIFQYITDEEKNNFIKNYNKKNNNEIIDSSISENFNGNGNENDYYFDYIRYIHKQNSDCFYRCFMFCLFEIYFLNKNKENLFILIIDILRLYLIEPEIFISKEIDMKNIMVIFNIIYDYISVNLWDKAYNFFINIYNTYEFFEKSLIEYMKYSIFLYISRISAFFWENEDGEDPTININNIYNFNYDLMLLDLFEPGKIEFQSIPYIFGINLNVFYYKNEKFSNLGKNLKKTIFNNNYTIDKVNNVINIFYYYNTFHPTYKKQIIDNIIAKNSTVDNNNTIYDLFFSNINESNNYLTKNLTLKQNNQNKFCGICNKNCAVINIENLSINICNDCLYKEIDNHLNLRLSFLSDEKYNNFTYYLNSIKLKLVNENNSDDTIKINISNYDYMFLYKKTFNERLSEIINDTCLMCSKKSDNLITLHCGCLVCYNCVQEIIFEITNNLIILNNYEKDELNEKNIRCKMCKKKLNWESYIKILKNNNFDLKKYYIDANERLKNYCASKCFSCGKDFENHSEDDEEDYLKFQVRDFGKSNDELSDNNNYKHVICAECYKILRKQNKKKKRIEGKEYKVIYCNICGRKHYIKLNEWKNNGVCCKCEIF